MQDIRPNTLALHLLSLSVEAEIRGPIFYYRIYSRMSSMLSNQRSGQSIYDKYLQHRADADVTTGMRTRRPLQGK